MRPCAARRVSNASPRRCLAPPTAIGRLSPRFLAPQRRYLTTARSPPPQPPPSPQDNRDPQGDFDEAPKRPGFFQRLNKRIVELGARKINDPWAKLQLAMHLLNENSITEGIDMLRSAANEGQSAAHLYLAELHREGELVPKDMVTAMMHYEKAAAARNLPALRFLGLFAYRFGIPGVVEQNEEKAFKMLEQAAVLGDPPAMAEYGSALLTGTGVSQDTEKGIIYLESAQKLQQDQAGYNLALFYLKRKEPGDNVKCVEWATAAAQTNPKAAMLMVSLLLEGKLIRRNMALAIELAQFVADFPTSEGDAARTWLREMERKTGKKLLKEEEPDEFTNPEADAAIEEEIARAKGAAEPNRATDRSPSTKSGT